MKHKRPLNCALILCDLTNVQTFPPLFFFTSQHSGSYQVLRENVDSCDSIDKMVQSDDTFAESASLTRRGSRVTENT